MPTTLFLLSLINLRIDILPGYAESAKMLQCLMQVVIALFIVFIKLFSYRPLIYGSPYEFHSLTLMPKIIYLLFMVRERV